MHQVLALADHAADSGSDELAALAFAPSAVVSPLGSPDRSHHTVATVVRRGADGSVQAWSRLLTVTGAGVVSSADVLDVLRDGPDGWRIHDRSVRPRHGNSTDSDAA